jgi:8-oxo-dGTP diphosphatase
MRYTLCFLQQGDSVLMLHRSQPPNQGLWNGVGGHIEPGETPMRSVLREVQEETGLLLPAARFAGLLTWTGFETPPGGLYIYTAEVPQGSLAQPPLTDEGKLAWKPRGWVCSAPEVVSNIHVFAPAVLWGGSPQWWHFDYQGETIRRHQVLPAPHNLPIGTLA